jgi:arginyl-tRNA synthetase
MPRWCWPSLRAPIRARWPLCWSQKLARSALCRGAEIAGPGFINLRLTDDAWRDELRAIATAGADYGRSTWVGAKSSTSNMSPPTRPARCTWAIAGVRWWAMRWPACSNLRAQGHPRILRQRCGRAGRCARPLGAHAVSRGAGRGIGRSRKGFIPAIIWCRSDRRWPLNLATSSPMRPKRMACHCSAPSAVAAMMDMIRDDLALLGIHHDLFSSEAELQAAGKPDEAESWLRAHDLVYDGVLEAPKGKTPGGLGAGRTAAVPLDQVWRRSGPPDQEIGRQLDLFRRRPRLSFPEGAKRRRAGRHLGRGPCGHGQADQGGRRGADRRRWRQAKPFDVKLVQMVQLLRDGEPVKMSKRAGNFVTLADVVARSARTWCASPC